MQLCALRYLGFAPDDLSTAPWEAVVYVAQRLAVSPDALVAYGRRIPTRTLHLQQAHEETWHRLTPLVTEARCRLLDGLLVSDPQTGRSLLQWFRREATSHAATQWVETLQKITVLREMGRDTWDLAGGSTPTE